MTVDAYEALDEEGLSYEDAKDLLDNGIRGLELEQDDDDDIIVTSAWMRTFDPDDPAHAHLKRYMIEKGWWKEIDPDSPDRIPVTPAQVRQLSLEVAAYQAHYALFSLIGDVWSDLDPADEIERQIAQRVAVDGVDSDLKLIEAKIKTVGDADEHVHDIARLLGAELNAITNIGDTNIRLSTNALSEYWIPMMEDSQ